MTVLTGAPEVLLVDGVELPPDVVAALGLPVHRTEGHAVTLGVPSVGVFGRDHPVVPGCFGWYVGPGTAPGWMAGTDGDVPSLLLAFGTALVQERAAAGFRAAGAGQPQPVAVDFDPLVLTGIPTGPVHRAPRTAAPWQADELLRLSFAAIERCCTPDGAIAAAPRAGPGEPDYWFFWQRDAAAVAAALHALSVDGPLDLRARAAARVRAWAGFVADLEGDLSASRCTMRGAPVHGWGDPQHDGPAATALVLQFAGFPADRFLAHLQPLEDTRGYDLWELRVGRSFHARHLRHRALRLPGLPSGPLLAVADPEPAWFAVTSALDASVVGSALLAHDGGDLEPFVPVVAALEEHYGRRWPAGGIGRFPEDANDGLGSRGGGAWPITTLWLAQFHLLRGDRAAGLRHLEFVLAHLDPASLHEQVDPRTGEGRGARGLAWAHAELVVTLLLL